MIIFGGAEKNNMVFHLRIASKYQCKFSLVFVLYTGQYNNKGLKLDTRWQNCLWLPQKDIDYGVIISKWLIFGEKYFKEIMLKKIEMCCPTKGLRLQDRYCETWRLWNWQKTVSKDETLIVRAREHLLV